MPDLHRREPRNVGVVLLHEQSGYARFLGQDPLSGELNPSLAAHVVQQPMSYQAWVKYFLYHANRGSWSRVQETLARRPLDSFYIEEGGVYELDYDGPREALEQLFRSLVDVRTAELSQFQGAGEHMRKDVKVLVDQVFVKAEIDREIIREPDFLIRVRGSRRTAETKVNFNYKYVNGSIALMERVPLSARNRDGNLRKINDLLYRIEHVLESYEVQRFIALYRVSGVDPILAQEAVDRELTLLETYADVLDVSDIPTAASNLRVQLGKSRH
ncbi:hypothetical protein [Sphaerimonospora thailandensis]|nr:hypothetical protein [Sphaerimonospora thailandensis]